MSKNNDNKTNYVAPLLLQAATQINLKKRGLVIKRLSVFVATLFMSVLVAKATSFDYTYQGKTLSYTILTSNTVSVSHSLNHALEGDVVIPPLLLHITAILIL